MKNEEFERAIKALYHPPGIDYVRHIRSALDENPAYLEVNEELIARKVEELLGHGSNPGDQDSMRQFAKKIVWEAVVRLRGVEDARTTLCKIGSRRKSMVTEF